QTETATPRVPLSERFGVWVPFLLVPVFLIVGYLLIGSGPTWATLTLAGLAMGMMIFVMASGLTLVFGLMDILNFGHGAFISIGAFVGATVLLAASGWTGAD